MNERLRDQYGKPTSQEHEASCESDERAVRIMYAMSCESDERAVRMYAMKHVQSNQSMKQGKIMASCVEADGCQETGACSEVSR